MKMDQPSPVAPAVDQVQNFSPPTASTNELSTTEKSDNKANDDVESPENQEQDSKRDDFNGKSDTEEENLLNYIAELAGENMNSGIEDQAVPEEELLGERPATPQPTFSKENLLGDKGIYDSPVSHSSAVTAGELDPNGESTSYLSTTSSPSYGSVNVSDFTSSAESSPRLKRNSALVIRKSPVVTPSKQSVNGEKNGEAVEGDIDEANGEPTSIDAEKEEDAYEMEEGQDRHDEVTIPDDIVQPEVSSTSDHAADTCGDSDRTNHDSMKADNNEPLEQNQSTETTGLADSTTSSKTDIEDADTARDELLDKFVAFCERFGSVSGSFSAASVRAKFRVTDLLKWFLEEEGRPAMPLTFQKRLRKAGFSVPASISLPPSQVVDMIIETAPEQSLKDICGKGGVAGNIDEIDTAIKRHQFSRYPAPNMTRFLVDIGYNLVSETAYRSALSKAVNELSSSGSSASAEVATVERQSQVVESIRRVYEDAKKQNQWLKLKTYRCPIDYCSFTTETQLQLYEHRRKPHKKTHRWECALCMKFSSWNDEDMEEHYNYEHGFTSSAKWDPPSSRAPCPLCDQDFPFKGQMKNHLRMSGQCPMNLRHVKIATGLEEEMDVLNLQLWPKVEERRAAQQQKAPSVRSRDSGVYGGQELRLKGGPPSARVADVVSLVAAGAGQLRSPPKTAASGQPLASSNLPRLLPSTVLRSTHVVPQQRLIQLQQQQQQLIRQINVAQQQHLQKPRMPAILAPPAGRVIQQQPTIQRVPPKTVVERIECEICDAPYSKKLDYLKHLQGDHRKLLDKSEMDLMGAAPLACSRCRDRFYSYEGLERHLLMEHNLVTNELLSKAQKRQDSGKCRICTRIYAFNLLQHLVQDHQRTLCSAEIVYSCDVCHFQCNSYVQLELHLRTHHVDNTVARPYNMVTSTPSQNPGYAQPSNTMSVITQRQQQQSALLLQQAPRLGQQQTSTLPQTAASILNAAMANHKRGFPSTLSTTRTNDQLERPPKLIKMADSGSKSSVAAPFVFNSLKVLPRGQNQPAGPAAPSQQQQLSANQRKQLRYCCTPCELKFISYEAVLKHWVERHLKPLRVPLCRIDKCEPCQEKLTLKRKADVNGTESAEGESEDVAEGPSKKPRMEEDGLILDLELPEVSESEVVAEDDEVEVLSPPKEIICLD